VVFNNADESAADECAGNNGEPASQRAAPGYLCVYWSTLSGFSSSTFEARAAPGGESTTGFLVEWTPNGTPTDADPQRTFWRGTWTYTAP
jgi:hypothetical protein